MDREHIIGMKQLNKGGIMKITMEFIDQRGFWHTATCNSKKKALKTFKILADGTEIKWVNKNKVIVSQQYINGGKK